VRFGVFTFTLSVASGVCSAASAEAPTPVRFSLEYVAADGCPGPAAFEAALQARLPSAERASPGNGVARLHVHLGSPSDGESREIWGDLPDGTSFQRAVPDASCAEALASMAVIAAMALEGNPDAPATLSDAAPPETPQPVKGSPSLQTERNLVSRKAPLAEGPRTAQPVARPFWDWSGAVGGGIASGVAESVAPEFAVGVEARYRSRAFFSPAWRLSGVYAARSSDWSTAIETHFRLLAARLAGCPAWFDRSAWFVTACAELELGALRGSASGNANAVAHTQSRAMPWLTTGLVARGGLRLGAALSLEANASGRRLWVRDRFTFRPAEAGNPAVLVHQVPDFAWDFALGLRYSFR
jgi:hypothetical protein